MTDIKTEYKLAVDASPWAETADRTHAFALGWLAKIDADKARNKISDQRGQFEKVYPLKSNVAWDPDHQRYVWNKVGNNLTDAMVQNQFWSVWQTAVAVNLGVCYG